MEVTIDALPDQSRTVTVRDDGGIYLPILGNVRASGLTVHQLRGLLQARLNRVLIDPTVMVGLVKTAPRSMVILGEVAKPGEIVITAETTLVEAVAMAGGPTPVGDLSSALLVRGKTTRTVSLLPPAAGGAVHPFYIKPGDVLYVRRAARIMVAGEVLSPGAQTLRQGSLNVWNAIMGAGGPKPGAALQRVLLARAGQDKPERLDLRRGSAAPAAQNPLEDGDVVTVPAQYVLIVGTASKAGVVPLTGSDNLFDLLVQAGVGDPGALADVGIIRARDARKGRRKVERVNLEKFVTKGDTTGLVSVHDGDIVVVNASHHTDLLQLLSPLWFIRTLIP